MQILKVEVNNFKIYTHSSVSFHPQLNFFYGDNGHGKTSLLEACYLGLCGKNIYSYRPQKAYIIKRNAEHASIKLWLQKEEGELVLERHFTKTNTGFNKSLLSDQKPNSRFSLKPKDFLVFTSEKLNVIKGFPEQRRRLVDDFLIFRGFSKEVYAFQACLKQKMSLLKSYKNQKCSLEQARDMLPSINETFMQACFQLLEKRLWFLQQLQEDLEARSLSLFHTPRPFLDFEYRVSDEKIHNLEQAKEKMRSQLKERASMELELGIPLLGLQKHDILFKFNGENSRFFCSQGQQRVFLLSILLSQIQEEEKPFLFLDDVLSELDEETQKKLLILLKNLSCQTFLTSCKKPQINVKKTWFFEINNGTIQSLNHDNRRTSKISI